MEEKNTEFYKKKKMVLLLFISLLNVPPIVCWGSVFGPCFIMQYIVSFLALQSY